MGVQLSPSAGAKTYFLPVFEFFYKIAFFEILTFALGNFSAKGGSPSGGHFAILYSGYLFCEGSSKVEHHVANVVVAGSSPVPRSLSNLFFTTQGITSKKIFLWR